LQRDPKGPDCFLLTYPRTDKGGFRSTYLLYLWSRPQFRNPCYIFASLCIQHLTQLFNAILLRVYFPTQWKVAQIILILKPGKPPHQLSSYRPIVSKVFGKLFLKRLLPLVEHANLIPNHQFGFQLRLPTIEQAHRLIRVLNDALDNSQYSYAAFFDISQAFNKVWHKGLLHKLRRSLPLNYYHILNSNLSNRYFVVNVNTELTGLTPS
jgi:hypothetical protein